LVFFHTSASRINSAINDNLPLNDPNAPECRDYFKYIHDDNFYHWAYQSWFKEIKEKYSAIKTIHFHCFVDTMDWSNLLPGMVYNTPLIHISIGELEGTDSEVIDQMNPDSRFNHMNDYNNQVMSKLIIDAIENYNVGIHQIDLLKFNKINDNAIHFPYPGFGTK
jgi:hypothetical protein